jgi:hypothetical protein
MATTYEWERLGGEVMDTRDLIAVAEEIREALDALSGENTLDGLRDESALEALESSSGCPDDDEAEAREILAAIEELESEGITDWQYGEALIREDYFTEYARQLADDIGAVNADAEWPNSYIDWERAAEALKQDYTEVEYRGVTYYMRA